MKNVKPKMEEKIVELKRIASANDNKLEPEVVVQEASSDDSPLHKYFEWDDSVAGQRWRVHQARMMIALSVEFIPGVKTSEEVKVFVSLRDERGDLCHHSRTTGRLCRLHRHAAPLAGPRHQRNCRGSGTTIQDRQRTQ